MAPSQFLSPKIQYNDCYICCARASYFAIMSSCSCSVANITQYVQFQRLLASGPTASSMFLQRPIATAMFLTCRNENPPSSAIKVEFCLTTSNRTTLLIRIVAIDTDDCPSNKSKNSVTTRSTLYGEPRKENIGITTKGTVGNSTMLPITETPPISVRTISFSSTILAEETDNSFLT